MNNTIIIDLGKYKQSNNSIFTGRPQGKAVRIKLNLDTLDKDISKKIIIKIPQDTTSFNPSFYLGLLFDSYKKLGVQKFEEKYEIELETNNPAIREVLQNNLDDGKRYAINSLISSSWKSIFK